MRKHLQLISFTTQDGMDDDDWELVKDEAAFQIRSVLAAIRSKVEIKTDCDLTVTSQSYD